MARPINNVFTLKSDATHDEHFVIHAFIDTAVEDCKFIKQVGFNRYVVENGSNLQGVITLVNGATEATEKGTGYIEIQEKVGGTVKNVMKLTKNVATAFDGSRMSWKFNRNEGQFIDIDENYKFKDIV